MPTEKDKGDMHIPVFALDNPLRRLLDHADKYCKYISAGQVVADLGCGPGFFTIPLAQKVGPNGRVYAVDSDVKPIRVVERKAQKKNLNNILARHTSASNLSFIENESVDFILADGLLCTMASREHVQAVNEMKRIMKSEGKAYLLTGRGSMSHVDDQEWEMILNEFSVIERNMQPYEGDRWALVRKKT